MFAVETYAAVRRFVFIEGNRAGLTKLNSEISGFSA
jgi:hypothetical protein